MSTQDRRSLATVVAFGILLTFAYRRTEGVDLTSSYLGGWAFITGQSAHLYGQDRVSYNLVSDPVWRQLADSRGFASNANLPPYVQTPLWGYLLQPLCRLMSFDGFKLLFLSLMSACFGGMIWLTASAWAPRLRRPGWVALVCAFAFALPSVRYSMQLAQTHMIFLVMALIAIWLARSGRPLLAGSLLAVAVAIKITPALLLVYWLITRQFRAAISFCVSSLAILALTLGVIGPHLFAEYLQSLGTISHILLVSWNNQSFAAFWMGRFLPASEIKYWHSLPLPNSVRIASLVLLAASAIWGGYLDRRAKRVDPGGPPYGAILTLVGATVFTPIAWSHYFAILLVPMMLLLDELLRRNSKLLLSFAIAISAFTMYSGGVAKILAPLQRAMPELVRSQFNAAILAMAALSVMSILQWRAGRSAMDESERFVRTPAA